MITSELTHVIDRPVTVDEVRAALECPITSDEREDVLALARWFTGRYTSAEERLAYVRRAYARWASQQAAK